MLTKGLDLMDAGTPNGEKIDSIASARRLRVLYLDHTAKIGGGEVAIFNLVCALDRGKYDPIFMLAQDGPLVLRLRQAGIEVHVLELDRSINEKRKDTLGLSSLLNIGQLITFMKYIFKLRTMMRILDVELVHTNSLKSDIYGGLAARLAGIPVVWHVHDSIDENYLPAQVVKMFRWMARVVPQYIVANSNSTLSKLLLGRKERAAVVYCGIRPEGIVQSYCNSAKTKRIIVTMVGRIAEWKGQHIFLRAAARVLKHHPGILFQVVGAPLFGEYDYEKSLRLLVNELGIESSVEFTGFREDVGELVRDCNVLVHASILGEPFGQVVIEGMAAGKPVVATRGGALPEIVVEGETGYLVEMGSAQEMADAILRLVENPERAQEMGEAGRLRIVNRFTIQQCASDLERVYEDMAPAITQK